MLCLRGLDPGEPTKVAWGQTSAVRRLVAVARFRFAPSPSQFVRLYSWDGEEDGDVDSAVTEALAHHLPHWGSLVAAVCQDLRRHPPRSAADRRVVRVLRWWVAPIAVGPRLALRVDTCVALWRALRAVDLERVTLRAAASLAWEGETVWRRGRMLALWFEARAEDDELVRLLCWKAVTGEEAARGDCDVLRYVLDALKLKQ